MKIYFVSLGCDKNSVDSEVMSGILVRNGHEFTEDPSDADAAVINTCCFIGDAKEESINNIISIGRYKTEGKLRALIVAGCLGQRYKDKIHELLPEVDAIVGIASIDKINEALMSVVDDKACDFIDETVRTPISDTGRVISTGGYTEYLKIAEGCNKKCTYCVIPSVRGAYRSIPMEKLYAEAQSLVQRGVKELILVAQETTLYGVDLYKEKSICKLINKLSEIEELRWIRVLYCYPEEITDELIDVIKNNPKVVHYLDLPIQSGSDRILKLMGRRTNKKEITELVAKLRTAVPDICLRTTLITGFPEETDKDHEESVKFVEELKFDRLGVFTYSREENTPAGEMKKQIPQRIKNRRRDDIMKRQQSISLSSSQKMIGRTLDVLVEGYIPDEGVYAGRSYKDAPDVDGYVFISSDKELMSGDFVSVKITDCSEYDLIGELI